MRSNMIEHDEKWLCEKISGALSHAENAKDYHEHMDRWRSISERPRHDHFVVMLDPDNADKHPHIAKWTSIKDACADMGEYDGWKWKPININERL